MEMWWLITVLAFQTTEAVMLDSNPAPLTVENSLSLRTGRVTVYTVKS